MPVYPFQSHTLKYPADKTQNPQLIMLSGYPSSGKTTRATQLSTFLTSKIASLPASDPRAARLKIHVVNDPSLGISKDVYKRTFAPSVYSTCSQQLTDTAEPS